MTMTETRKMLWQFLTVLLIAAAIGVGRFIASLLAN